MPLPPRRADGRRADLPASSLSLLRRRPRSSLPTSCFVFACLVSPASASCIPFAYSRRLVQLPRHSCSVSQPQRPSASPSGLSDRHPALPALPATTLRGEGRLRREYLYRKSLAGADKAHWEHCLAIRRALARGAHPHRASPRRAPHPRRRHLRRRGDASATPRQPVGTGGFDQPATRRLDRGRTDAAVGGLSATTEARPTGKKQRRGPSPLPRPPLPPPTYKHPTRPPPSTHQQPGRADGRSPCPPSPPPPNRPRPGLDRDRALTRPTETRRPAAARPVPPAPA